jgi:hypothetical protein
MTNDINYCYYAVAFIDVLGQKEAFEGINNLEGIENPESKRRLIKAHQETVLFVEKLREGFESFFKAYTKQSGQSKDKVPDSKKEQYVEMCKCLLKHQRFSDCIQAYTPLQTKKYHSTAMNGVYGILAACGGMFLLALTCNKVFRAGVDVGIGTEMSNGEIYGPALFKAYELESKIAQYPRIVIGDMLMNYLANLSKGNPQLPNQTKEDIGLCKTLADRCLKMIVPDAMDGRPILDYLGSEFRKFEEQLPEDSRISYADISRKAFLFVRAECERWEQKKDEKLAVRYRQLYSYFQTKGFKD